MAPDIAAIEEAAHGDLPAMPHPLKAIDPQLRRPHADTLSVVRHASMKELRFAAIGGVWRTPNADDPERHAIVLIAGGKAGTAQKRCSETLIALRQKGFGSFEVNWTGSEKIP